MNDTAYFINGHIFFKPEIPENRLFRFSEKLEAAGVYGVCPEEGSAFYVDGGFDNEQALENVLISMAESMSGMCLECTRQDVEISDDGRRITCNIFDFLYTIKDGHICKDPGFVLYRSSIFRNGENETMRKALELYKEKNPEEADKCERALLKLENLEGSLESYQIS